MRRGLACILFPLSFLCGSSLAAQTLRGPEIRVGPPPAAWTEVDVAENGDFVVAWQVGFEHLNQVPKVWYRRFRADGVPKGRPQRVSGSRAGEFGPQVSVGDDGRFVIVWTGGDASDTSVWGRRFDAQGRPLGGRFRLSTITAGSQSEASVAVAPDGGFVAAWRHDEPPVSIRSGDVYLRRFDADGKPLGPEAVASNTTFHEQSSPRLAMGRDGRFLLGWVSFGGEGTFYDVFARRFAADGAALGDEFQVNSGDTVVTSQYDFALAVSDSGSFVGVWTDDAADADLSPSEADFVGLLGQLFAADGSPLGPPFRVNTTTRGSQRSPSVVFTPQQNFFVLWSSFAAGEAASGLIGRRFDRDGRPRSREIVIDSEGGGAALAMTPSGRGFVVWASPDGVVARRLVAPPPGS